MKKLPIALSLSILVFCASSAVALGQQAQNGQGNNGSPTVTPTSQPTVSPSGSPVQAQIQTQNASQGTGIQQQISQEVQAKINETISKYSAVSSQAKQSIYNTNTAATSMIKLAAGLQTQNAELATQIQNTARAQVQATEKIAQNIDKTQSKNSIAKFFTGPDYKLIKETNQLMEQNQQRIQTLNQVKSQVENSAQATELQNQINLLEAQNTMLQDQIDQVSGGFSLFGWLFKWANG